MPRGNMNLPCPQCPKVCTSNSGLSLHMNATHLVLSPTQTQAKDRLLTHSAGQPIDRFEWCNDHQNYRQDCNGNDVHLPFEEQDNQ